MGVFYLVVVGRTSAARGVRSLLGRGHGHALEAQDLVGQPELALEQLDPERDVAAVTNGASAPSPAIGILSPGQELILLLLLLLLLKELHSAFEIDGTELPIRGRGRHPELGEFGVHGQDFLPHNMVVITFFSSVFARQSHIFRRCAIFTNKYLLPNILATTFFCVDVSHLIITWTNSMRLVKIRLSSYFVLYVCYSLSQPAIPTPDRTGG